MPQKIYTIGFSGPHNTGKTTTLRAIDALNLPNIHVDTVSVSRMVLTEMGHAEGKAEGLEDFQSFQDRVFLKKMEHLQELHATVGPDVEFILTDRTPLDFYAYAAIRTPWTHTNTWFQGYQKRCLQAFEAYHTTIFFPIQPWLFAREPQRASEGLQVPHSMHCKHFMSMTPNIRYRTIEPRSIFSRVTWCVDLMNEISEGSC